ncbi:MAG: elongation factor P maturation arginine rhamnosyltransferase EarP [Burkholderiales bacterium]|nr:elongation factor P maturation arginine rhamnosyltransferase EarP [Burkholderiales bacterium]
MEPAQPDILPTPTHTLPLHPALLWDVFCRVIDNFGDIGVCWRLCADLAGRGHTVRLWVDDASALQWMAPGAIAGDWPGVTVHDWNDSANAQVLAALMPADVWVEGFGCEIAPEFIASRAYLTGATGIKDLTPPVWINLEYLSAEPYVERAHGLPSPVMAGPAKGWTKHFYYPGFHHRTGGLLREPDLLERQRQFDSSAWLHQMGLAQQPGERLISLFCYEPPALDRLLTQLAQMPGPTRLLVTPGRASAAIQASLKYENDLQPAPKLHKALSISYLPALSQRNFDHLLWACDLNCVRGEDSLVRALWAGKPLLWHIYPQSDAAHHEKLDAFLDMLDASASLRHWHALWNGIEKSAPGDALDGTDLKNWQQITQNTRSRLLELVDLTSGLVDFAMKKR